MNIYEAVKHIFKDETEDGSTILYRQCWKNKYLIVGEGPDDTVLVVDEGGWREVAADYVPTDADLMAEDWVLERPW